MSNYALFYFYPSANNSGNTKIVYLEADANPTQVCQYLQSMSGGQHTALDNFIKNCPTARLLKDTEAIDTEASVIQYRYTYAIQQRQRLQITCRENKYNLVFDGSLQDFIELYTPKLKQPLIVTLPYLQEDLLLVTEAEHFTHQLMAVILVTAFDDSSRSFSRSLVESLIAHGNFSIYSKRSFVTSFGEKFEKFPYYLIEEIEPRNSEIPKFLHLNYKASRQDDKGITKITESKKWHINSFLQEFSFGNDKVVAGKLEKEVWKDFEHALYDVWGFACSGLGKHGLIALEQAIALSKKLDQYELIADNCSAIEKALKHKSLFDEYSLKDEVTEQYRQIKYAVLSPYKL